MSLRANGAVAALMSAMLVQAPARSDIMPQLSDLTEVTVTGSRLPEERLEFAGSITRLDQQTVDLIGANHHSELLNRIAGVQIQRGSGQESLTAIRSPVLSGPGSCGAFLVLEDGMPIRPVGFCNVNEMFELNNEQAGAIEVIRGAGPASYGANALHGIVNVITPAAADLPSFAGAVEGGSDDYRRVKFKAGTDSVLNGVGLYGAYVDDGGFRVDSGFKEAKLNLLADKELASGTLRIRAAGTNLDQETAGFIQGFDAYRNPAVRFSNPNPESYRDAWSSRLSAHWMRETCPGCTDSLQAVVRKSHMEFLQHFLIGKPLESNGQTSFALSGGIARPINSQLRFHTGIDLEVADADLLEFQANPTTDGAPAANAIRPAGKHYDYSVDGRTAGGFATLDWTPSDRWRFGAALRLENTHYDYDNHMIAGNTAENGVPCTLGGCLYSRPADRKDSFTNVAPKVDASYQIAARQRVYASAARGFRPPEMTELYRLQRQQSFADLDSERLDSIELGWLGSLDEFSWTLAAYSIEKDNVILRDANAFNVSDGQTSHRGFEYELRLQPLEHVGLSASGSVAWHRYEFNEAIEQGETIRKGNTVDTAPRNMHNVAVSFEPFARTSGEVEVAYMGRYFVDAANANTYPGHTLVNTRLRYELSTSWQAIVRVTNLFGREYADRADYAFGNYRYFPGRPRSWFLEIAYAAQ